MPHPKAPALVAFACVAAFYVWTARSDNLSWHWGREQTDYYNLLVDGFLEGRLSLKAEVPAELLASPNPYDPDVRPAGVALHDASLFRGKYYIYHGVTPAVVLLLPFRLLTGTDLPIAAGVLVFVLAGYAASLGLLGRIRARFFPDVGAGATTGLAIVLGVASCTAILLRRGSLYDLPIASGYAFAMAALLCLWQSLFDSRRPLRWLAASSLCWGLAIGSRPIYLFAPACVMAAGVFLLRSRRANWRQAATAALAPLAVVGALLAAYNYARFGSITEFGVRYILSGVYESQIEHFRPRYAPWNVFAYLFSGPEWARYFPFQHDVAIALPRPRQHFGMDIPFGLLRNVPFLWLAALVPIALLRRAGEAGVAEWRILVGAVAWTALSVFGFLLCFYAAMVRYLADFAPAVALLAAMGALCGWMRVQRRMARALLGGMGVITVGLVLLFSVRVYDRVRQFNPQLFRGMATVANAPVHWFEAATEEDFGAVTLDVSFPPGVTDNQGRELLVTGSGDLSDRVLAFLPDQAHVVFGYEHAGAPMLRSVPLPINRGERQAIRISLGSLFPPETHPALAAWSAAERSAVLRRVVIEWKGSYVLNRHQRAHEASPATMRIGAGVTVSAREGLPAARRRAATVLIPVEEGLLRPDAAGTTRLRVRFPEAMAGRREPLLVSGETRRGDVLAVEYLGRNRLRFVFEHWGRRPYLGPSFTYSPDREYRIEVSHPFYAPAKSRGVRVGEGALTITIDGASIWEVAPLFYPLETSDDVFVGHNPIGGSASEVRFTGTIAPGSAP